MAATYFTSGYSRPSWEGGGEGQGVSCQGEVHAAGNLGTATQERRFHSKDGGNEGFTNGTWSVMPATLEGHTT